MHEAYYKIMDLDEAGINRIKELFAKKYKEYMDATKKKEGQIGYGHSLIVYLTI